jgi:hypothetical protein
MCSVRWRKRIKPDLERREEGRKTIENVSTIIRTFGLKKLRDER